MCLAFVATVLAGCGGGGGGGGSANNQDASFYLQVSPLQITVSAQTTDAAPTAQFQAGVATTSTTAPTQQFYIDGSQTHNGINTTTGAADSNGGAVYTVNFKSPASLGVGTYTDTITIEGCFDQACTRQVTSSPQTVSITYNVTVPAAQLPQLYSVNPQSATAGAPDFTLTVSGYNFVAQSVVLWNNTPLPTTYVSSNQLTAQVAASNVAAAGNFAITVSNGAGAVSSAMTFTVNALPALSMTSISPTEVPAGSPDFYVTVGGTGFSAVSLVTWNGTALPTTYVSGTTLRGSVSASQVAATGTAHIAVDSGSASTSTIDLTITMRNVDAVAYQMNAAHTGAVTFNAVTLPSSSTWSVDVGGTPSYALIAGGKVIVTVSVNGNSQLVAMDFSTGSTVWGPIAFPGNANAAYEHGRVFVVSGSSVESQIITAIDATNGNTVWSAVVPGGWFPAPPVASGGVVYTTNGGLVTAFDEATGANLWQTGISGTSGIVAVSLDGLYGAAPCTALDLVPRTGTLLWSYNSGCSGGGGATPVVANGLVYAPSSSAGSSGTVFNSETGEVKGSYAASVIPAFSATAGFYLSNGTLQGQTVPNNTVIWSFAGDAQLSTAPIVVNNYVFIGSQSGNLYGLDATSGQQIWTKNLGAAIPGTNEFQLSMYSGLAAGDGLLVVPSGTKVTAFVLSTNP